MVMVGSRFKIPAEVDYSPMEVEALGVSYGLEKTKYFTLDCPKLYIGTDHKPLPVLLGDNHMKKIDNPILGRLKEKNSRLEV